MYDYCGNNITLHTLLVLDGNVIIQVYSMYQLLLMLVQTKLVNRLDSMLNGRYVHTYNCIYLMYVCMYI